MACQATRRSRGTKFGSGRIRKYDFPENRVMAGQNFTWNENESYAQYAVSKGLVGGGLFEARTQATKWF